MKLKLNLPKRLLAALAGVALAGSASYCLATPTPLLGNLYPNAAANPITPVNFRTGTGLSTTSIPDSTPLYGFPIAANPYTWNINNAVSGDLTWNCQPNTADSTWLASSAPAANNAFGPYAATFVLNSGKTHLATNTISGLNAHLQAGSSYLFYAFMQGNNLGAGSGNPTISFTYNSITSSSTATTVANSSDYNNVLMGTFTAAAGIDTLSVNIALTSGFSGLAAFAIVPVVNVPPAIVTPPVGNIVVTNSSHTFTVGATGTAPLHYQWSFVIGGVTNDINNATNSSYTINPVTSGSAGSYFVTITNVAGSITSEPPAVLTVLSQRPTALLGAFYQTASSEKPATVDDFQATIPENVSNGIVAPFDVGFGGPLVSIANGLSLNPGNSSVNDPGYGYHIENSSFTLTNTTSQIDWDNVSWHTNQLIYWMKLSGLATSGDAGSTLLPNTTYKFYQYTFSQHGSNNTYAVVYNGTNYPATPTGWSETNTFGNVFSLVVSTFTTPATGLPDFLYLQATTPDAGGGTSGDYLGWTSFAFVQQAAAVPPTISIAKGAGSSVILTYTGTLVSCPTVNGTYTAVIGASSPWTISNPSGNVFYKTY